MIDLKVTYQELDEVLHLLKFSKVSDERGYVYTYSPLEAVIKTPKTKSAKEVVNGGILSGHAYILEQKGVITRANVLYRLVENQRFVRENVLV